jgi:glycosyltransferase involved in cell wall biosynthesis
LPKQTALLCENNNVSEFSTQLLKLIDDDAMRSEMAKKGWIHVKEKFHFTRLVSDMENLYKKLLKRDL